MSGCELRWHPKQLHRLTVCIIPNRDYGEGRPEQNQEYQRTKDLYRRPYPSQHWLSYPQQTALLTADGNLAGRTFKRQTELGTHISGLAPHKHSKMTFASSSPTIISQSRWKLFPQATQYSYQGQSQIISLKQPVPLQVGEHYEWAVLQLVDSRKTEDVTFWLTISN